MPGRAAGEPPLLQQDDVAPALLRQVIRDRTANNAAADDDGASAVRKSRGDHSRTGSSSRARLSYQQITTKCQLYFATMMSQPQPVQTDARLRSGIWSTITPAHLSMLGTRNGVRRVN